jgi:hypothetical protein
VTIQPNRLLMVALSHPGAVPGPYLLTSLRLAGWAEAVVVAGLGRTEVYTVSPDADTAGIVTMVEADPDLAWAAAEVLTDDAVAHHLFRVASGLEQDAADAYERLRLAYRDAQAAGMCSPDLSQLMHAALRCGFAVRQCVEAGAPVVDLTTPRPATGEMFASRLVDGAVDRYLSGVAAHGSTPVIPRPRAGRRTRADAGG